MRIWSLIAVVMLLIAVCGLVSASICDFNGTVKLDKRDLANYTSDQLGCAIGKTSDSSSTFIVWGFILVLLVVAYGLWGRKR